jgi:hypothetical protein
MEGNEDAPTAQVNLHFSHRKQGGRGGSMRARPRCSAHRDLYPRQQLLLRERPTDEFIGAGFLRCGALAFPPACHEREDRHLAPLAQPPYHLHGIPIVVLEINQEDVGSTFLDFPKPLGESRHLDQPEPMTRKRPSDQAPELKILLDDESSQAHHKKAAFPVAMEASIDRRPLIIGLQMDRTPDRMGVLPDRLASAMP